jgi:hypothetical protein
VFIEKRKNVNKGNNLLNPYVLKVLLSIPFNKLPYILANEKIGNRKFVNNAENSFIVHPV